MTICGEMIVAVSFIISFISAFIALFINHLCEKYDKKCIVCNDNNDKHLRGFDLIKNQKVLIHKIDNQKLEKCDFTICYMCMDGLKKL